MIIAIVLLLAQQRKCTGPCHDSEAGSGRHNIVNPIPSPNSVDSHSSKHSTQVVPNDGHSSDSKDSHCRCP